MDFADLQKRALQVQQKYVELNQRVGRPAWTEAEYMQALVGDIGDLAKLIMAKNKFREIPDFQEKIGHELSDCLWALCVLAKLLKVNLETEFEKTMQSIEQKISDQ